MLPTREEALAILEDGGCRNPGPWTQHSLCAAECAEKIARRCGMDGEKAYVLGLLHDIGRRFGVTHFAHIPDGWNYLNRLGYGEAAKVCLTHSFPIQSLDEFIGRLDVPDAVVKSTEAALLALEYDDYDRLIQLCDCLAGTEVMDMEARMDDVARRYGFYPEKKREANRALRRYFEEKAGADIYRILESPAQTDEKETPMELSELMERMHNGKLYYYDDALWAEQFAALEKLYDFNRTRPGQMEERAALLKDMLGDMGENCYIEPPFHANWGGKHVHFGSNVYANFNLTMVDDTHIYVGDNVLFGPNVTVCTAAHPIHIELRRKQAQYNEPVHIGANVWIGANVTILPGVTIGENSVIGAGSVVSRDIPANVIAVGTPCRVLREIGEEDERFYGKHRAIDME